MPSHRTRGQSSVEALALLPAVALLAVAAWWICASAAAWLHAGSAARAGARAAAVGDPAGPAVRAVLGGGDPARLLNPAARDGVARVRIEVAGPALPGLPGARLGVEAEAIAP